MAEAKAETDPIREMFVHQAGEIAASLGLNRSVGQLYALLYMSREPVCLDEMADTCMMSKASASTNIRELERWNAARKVFVPGDRKDYYEANRDVPAIVIARAQDGLGRRMEAMAEVLNEADRRVSEMNGDEEARKFYLERLAEMQGMRKSAERALRNLDKLYRWGKRFL